MSALDFSVLIPARLASTRLPNKPLADLAGLPMIVRVAHKALQSGAQRVVVATDHEAIASACDAHGITSLLTRADHPSGSDRLAEACEMLGLAGDDLIVNLQGDEPLMTPSLLAACAALLHQQRDCVMSTVAHAITDPQDWLNPNVVKVVLDAQQRALYFSRASIPFWRDGARDTPPQSSVAWRHLGLYAYRAGFLRQFPQMPPSPLEQVEALEQLRVLWHGHRIAVHLCDDVPGTGVDTPEDLSRVRALMADGSA